MIHFLYVDRTTNEMTGTSFAVGSDQESNKVQCLIIKKNVSFLCFEKKNVHFTIVEEIVVFKESIQIIF